MKRKVAPLSLNLRRPRVIPADIVPLRSGLPARRPLPAALNKGLVTATAGVTALAGSAADDLLDNAPTFGNLLRSIGAAVVATQDALDDSVIDAVTAVGNTKIEVATTVIQHLNDHGLPDSDATEIVTQELSLLDFVMPTVHEVSSVGVSMELEAASTDSKSGVTFKQAGGSLNFDYQKGGGWAGDLSLAFHSSNVETRSRTDWARSRITLDAELTPRRTTKLADPVTMTLGPAILIHTERADTAAERVLKLDITLRNSSGAPLSGASVFVDAGPLRTPTMESTGAGGTTATIELKRPATLTEGAFAVIVTFGDLVKRIDVNL